MKRLLPTQVSTYFFSMGKAKTLFTKFARQLLCAQLRSEQSEVREKRKSYGRWQLGLVLLGLFLAGCHQTTAVDSLSLIQIQDRNGLTETISNPERLLTYHTADFLSAQPYKKVLRVYKGEGKNSSIITTYHPNGNIRQYLEAKEMRAFGPYREWYANGIQKIEANVIGGTADLADGTQQDWLFEGESQVWDEQGNQVALINYKKGFLEGKSTYFYPSGQMEKELFFTDNLLSGTAKEFSPAGVLISQTEFSKGIKQGESRGYFENGNCSWIEDYLDGRLREGRYYDLNGELFTEVHNGGGFQARYEPNGSLTLTEFQFGKPEGLIKKITASGEVLRTYFVKGGRKNGLEIEYYLLGKEESEKHPKLSVMWKDNAVHGPVKTWYDNGELESERNFSLNVCNGPALAWYRDGSLMIYEEYDSNHLVKGQYFKIQKKEPVSTIVKGAGVATLFDENGKFLRKVNYLNGKPIEPED